MCDTAMIYKNRVSNQDYAIINIIAQDRNRQAPPMGILYPPSQKTMGLPMDECTKSYGVISPQTMGG